MQNRQIPPLLRLLFWETTIKCNLSCAHCRRVESNESVGRDLSTQQGRELIGQLADLGKNQGSMPVLVFSGGEPLCRADLFGLIRQAKSLGIVPALATNATLIDVSAAENIASSGIVRVAVSLDGATAEVHDRLRQVVGSFDRALAGTGFLRDKGIPFQINVTLTRQNTDQLEAVYELAGSLGAAAVHVFMLVPVGCGQVLAETDMLSPQQYEQVLTRICELERRDELQIKVTCGPHYERVVRERGMFQERVRQGRRRGETVGTSPPAGVSRGCLAGFGVLFVGHQGDVFPCGYLPVKCGNILEETLSDIWHDSKDLARMRDVESLEGKCGVCGYRHVCGGCRARAYAATGNYLAEEPFCTYVPPDATR